MLVEVKSQILSFWQSSFIAIISKKNIKSSLHKAFNCNLERFWKESTDKNGPPLRIIEKNLQNQIMVITITNQPWSWDPEGPLNFKHLIKFRMFCFVVWGWDKIGPWWLTPFELSRGFNLKTCAWCVAITDLLAHPFSQFRFGSSVNNAQYLSFHCPNHSSWTNIQTTDVKCVYGTPVS